MTQSHAQPSTIAVIKQLPSRIKKHNVVVTAAGIAFYGLLALVPTLIATVSIYGLVNQGNEAEIKDQISSAASSLDQTTADFVADQLTDITSSGGNLLALIVGIILALFSASGAVQKLMNTITVAYETTESRPGWRVRLLAYVFTLGAIIGVIVMVTMVGVIPVILGRAGLSGPASAALQIIQLPLFGLLFLGALTILYRYGPDRTQRTPWRNRGAVFAVVLWVLFAVAFSFYSANIGAMPASYGLLGTVAALMIFLQVTAITVIIGAEVNALSEAHLKEQATDSAIQAATSTRSNSEPVEPLGFGKAAAGLAALFFLGRGPE